MVTATFRFYEELNDFLPPDRRGREFSAPCAPAATTKQAIEALGVPPTEVELILVNGESVGFLRLIEDGDRVAVYPKFEAFDITPLLRVREWALRVTRFVADTQLRIALAVAHDDPKLVAEGPVPGKPGRVPRNRMDVIRVFIVRILVDPDAGLQGETG